MRIQVLVRTAVAAACTAALVAAPALTSAATARPAERARAATPTITAKVTKQGVSLKGVSGLHAGRAKLVVKGKGDISPTFGSLEAGYSWQAFSKDLVAGFFKNKSAAIRRVYAKADAIGGLVPGETGSIVFPHPGRYFAVTIGPKGPTQPVWFDVGAKRSTRTPHIDGKILAKDGPGWGGGSQLPARGTLMFKNAATTSVLHFLELQHVKEGTTVDEVLATFQGPESQGPPPWFMPGSVSTDVLAPHRSMTLDYDLPPGQYVALCFMPDPDMHGMPHALMGMIKMIHLS
jgi:hypothetical protein